MVAGGGYHCAIRLMATHAEGDRARAVLRTQLESWFKDAESMEPTLYTALLHQLAQSDAKSKTPNFKIPEPAANSDNNQAPIFPYPIELITSATKMAVGSVVVLYLVCFFCLFYVFPRLG